MQGEEVVDLVEEEEAAGEDLEDLLLGVHLTEFLYQVINSESRFSSNLRKSGKTGKLQCKML